MKVYIDLSDKRNETVLRKMLAAGFEQENKPCSAIGEGYIYIFTPKTVIGLRQAFDIAEKSIVFAYRFDKEAEEVLIDRKCAVVDIMKDETFVWKNAELTADAVSEILQKKQFNSPSVLITGYGRVAKTAAAKLSKQGMKIVIAARSKLAREQAYHNGLKAVSLEEVEWGAFDVIINTVPALIITEKEILKMKPNVYLMDLASLPGGIEKTAAEKHKIEHEQALGLPGKFYPEKAGMILAERILKEL